MDILLIGGGGREAAIAWKLSRSSRIGKLYCAPGNHGISKFASCFPVAATDLEGIVNLAKTLAVDLVFVAPDDPLAMGLVDRLEASGIRAFGPRAVGAQLESSKSFAKKLMKEMRIPTAAYEIFSNLDSALAYAQSCPLPQVVKADGLALGKGVVICYTRDELLGAIRDILADRRFGEAGKTILIEEFLVGPELTLLAFTDGLSYRLMPPSRDHKRAFDGDLGPNTGGMGAVVPGADLSPESLRRIEKEIVSPTLEGLRLSGIEYKGILYFGLMLTESGPKVIEYNARFGDPECQAILPLLDTDLLEIVQAILARRLNRMEIKWKKDAAACVVMASGGYPASYEKGYVIHGLDRLETVVCFEAGTKSGPNGTVLTDGGRVLSVVALAPRLEQALDACYREISKIEFKDKMLRYDIGRTQHSSAYSAAANGQNFKKDITVDWTANT